MAISSVKATTKGYSSRALIFSICAVLFIVVDLITAFDESSTASFVASTIILGTLLVIAGYNTGMWLVARDLEGTKPVRRLPPRRLPWCVVMVGVVTAGLVGLSQTTSTSGQSGSIGAGAAALIVQVIYAYLAPLIGAVMVVRVLSKES